MGFEPTNDFRRCRFSSPGTPLRDCRREHRGKPGSMSLRPFRSAARPPSRHSAEPRHAPPPRATPRTVAGQAPDKACLARPAGTRIDGMADSGRVTSRCLNQTGGDHSDGTRGLMSPEGAPGRYRKPGPPCLADLGPRPVMVPREANASSPWPKWSSESLNA